MTPLRLNMQVAGIIVSGVFFYLVALLQINPDDLGPLFALLLLPFAFKDIRFLIVAWFILAVYYAKTGVDTPPNYAANVSHNVLVPVATAITAVYYRLHNKKMHFGIEELVLVVFIAYSVISATLFATDKYGANRSVILNYLLPLCLYWMVKNMTIDETILKMLALASLFHLVVLLPVGIYEYQNSKSLFLAGFKWADVGDKGRISGPLGSPIVLGCLIPILFFNVYVAVRSQLIPRYVLWISGALSSVLIILTFTRSVWLGAFLAFIYVFLAADKEMGTKVIRVGGFVALAAVSLTVLTLSSPDIEKRLTGEENANFRVVMAEASVDMIMDRPLLGWGTGTFDDVVDRYLFDARGVYIVKDTSHVTLLTLLAELGIVGTSFFLMFIYFALRRRGLRLADLSPVDRLIVVANMGSLISIVINAFLIDMRFYSIAYAWFCINLGFIHNIHRKYILAEHEAS